METKFVKGKWYEFWGIYVKFDCLEKDKFIWTEIIFYDIKTYENRVGWLRISYLENEADMNEVRKFLPENHPDLLVGLPEEYIVQCDDIEECSNVRQSYYKDGYIFKLYYRYLVCSGKEMDNKYYENYIPKDYKHLPVFKYNEWKQLKDKSMKEEWKYTVEYCKNPINRVAIHVDNDKEVEECDKLLGLDHGYLYRSNLNSLQHISASSNTHTCSTYYKDNGYEVIEAKDFIKNNTKSMKDKKIIGYKLKEDCKQYENAVAEILNSYSPNWWKTCAIDNLKEKGYNFVEGGDVNNSVQNRLEKLGLLNLWFIPVYEETSKELYFGEVKFIIKKGDDFATTGYGKVTKEEIKKVINYIQNPPSLISGQYDLNFHYKDSRVLLHNLETISDIRIGFGCQKGEYNQLVEIYKAFEV